MLAREIGAINYLECSAKTDENVKEVFAQVSRVLVDHEKIESAKLAHKLGE